MKTHFDPRLVRRLHFFAAASAVFSVAVGVSGLAGWAFDIQSLDTWGAAPVTMKANTSACFILIGVSLWLLRTNATRSLAGLSKFVARIAAAVTTLMGLLTLWEHIFARDFGIDQFLYRAPPAIETASIRPGLMSPITAVAFLLFGLALLGIDWRTRRGRWPAQVLSLAAGASAMFGVLSFAFDPRIYSANLSLALPTAVTMVVFSLGLVCSRTDRGLGSLLCSRGLDGSLARRLLPAAFIPVVVGWIRWRVTASGIYSEWSVVVLASLLTMSLLLAIIAWVAVAVDRNEVERRKVEEALNVSEEQLNRLLDRLDEPPAERSLRRKVTAGFVVAVSLTIFVGVSGWRSARRSADDAYWVAHTYEVMGVIQSTSRHLIEAGTSARAFALTGQEPLLAHYETARDSVFEDENRLRKLTKDNSSQQQRLDELFPQVLSELEFSERIIAHRRRFETSFGSSDALRTEALINQVRATTLAMDAEEVRLLRQRTERAASGQKVTTMIAVISALLGVGLWVLARFAVNREIGVSARTRSQIISLNADLEQRVQLRTADLQSEITERKSALKQLADQKFALNQHGIVAVTDVQGTITYVNEKFCAISQYPKAELIGRNHRILNSGHHSLDFFQQMYRSIAKGQVWHGEIQNRAKDGSLYWVATTIVPFMDVEGKPYQYVAIRADITERKRVEEALLESEDRFEAMANGIQQLAWMADADGSIFWYNTRWYEYTGTSFEQMQGWGWQSVHDPNALPKVIERWKVALTDGTPLEMEFPLRGADGIFHTFLTQIMPVKNSAGEVTRWFGTNTDITERKKAEEVLHEQSTILDLAQVLVRDMDSHIVLWNLGAEKLYGFTKQEALGQISHDLLHTKFPAPIVQMEEELHRNGIWEGELIHRKRDGGQIVVSSLWVLHRDAEGEPIRVLEANVDITARKQAEELLTNQAMELARQAEELAQSRQALEDQTVMFKLVLENMGEGLIAADREGHFLIWNNAAMELMGRGPVELPTADWTPHYKVFLPDGVTPYPPERLPLVRALRGESVTVELIVRQPNNEAGKFMEVTARPLKDAPGNLCGGVAVLRDITQRKASEGEIQKLNDELEIRVVERTAQLEDANKELEAFSYSVSHDLRAPLRHISGFSRMLVEEFSSALDPIAQSYLGRIQSGTQKMGLLVDELLNLARVGRHSLNLQRTSLDAIIADVVAILEPESEGRQVHWQIADMPAVECDPVLVKQIFQNLLANALKFTRTRELARIEIGTENADDGPLVFVVRDNGIGFNMKYVDKLFGVFQRLHRAEDFEGTGIGLATVQRIVKKHGGKAWAEGELDKGAAFYFTLSAANRTLEKSKEATAGGQQ
jgi:PAS domain S-box-containing protein